MKFATKPIRQYTSHLRRVATLPWEIKIQISADIQRIWKKMQTNCIFLASHLLFIHKFRYFGV